MRRKIRNNLITLVVLASTVSATVASAQIFSPYRFGPPIVRFIGAFQPFSEKDAGNLNTLTVSIQNQQWLFQIARVDTVTGSDPGMLLLSRIFPPQLHFLGPPERLAPLENPAIVGKQVTFEGFLYISDRTFYVSSANVAS